MAKGSLRQSPGFSPYSHYNKPLHEKPIFHYIAIALITATLIMSILTYANTNQLKKDLAQKSVNINDLLRKLTSHNEMKGYVGVAPLNVVQINNDNIANLQAQIKGIDMSYAGNFIVQYTDRIVIYDYDNDIVRGTISLQAQQPQLPADFLTKLHKHPELQALQSQQPIGGQLDQASLNTLKQQFPDVYANAKVGDFLLRYPTKLVIYDYSQDRIVNLVNLG